MQKIVSVKCPKCNNKDSFYRYGKDRDGYQKYLCRKCNHQFAPFFNNLSLELIPMLDFNSDEWHADETVVKISGQKYYIWFIIDSETRFVLGFHLSPYRNSEQVLLCLTLLKILAMLML